MLSQHTKQTAGCPYEAVEGGIASDVCAKVEPPRLTVANVGELCLLLLEGLHDFSVALVLHGKLDKEPLLVVGHLIVDALQQLPTQIAVNVQCLQVEIVANIKTLVGVFQLVEGEGVDELEHSAAVGGVLGERR